MEDYSKFFQHVMRQKSESITAAATYVDSEGNRPPEVRLGRIDSSGRVRLEFTNSMSFPSKAELITLNRESDNSLIDLMVISSDDDDADQMKRSPNLLSWEIVSVS